MKLLLIIVLIFAYIMFSLATVNLYEDKHKDRTVELWEQAGVFIGWPFYLLGKGIYRLYKLIFKS